MNSEARAPVRTFVNVLPARSVQTQQNVPQVTPNFPDDVSQQREMHNLQISKVQARHMWVGVGCGSEDAGQDHWEPIVGGELQRFHVSREAKLGAAGHCMFPEFRKGHVRRKLLEERERGDDADDFAKVVECHVIELETFEKLEPGEARAELGLFGEGERRPVDIADLDGFDLGEAG